jgi:hypothetical protein
MVVEVAEVMVETVEMVVTDSGKLHHLGHMKDVVEVVDSIILVDILKRAHHKTQMHQVVVAEDQTMVLVDHNGHVATAVALIVGQLQTITIALAVQVVQEVLRE